MKTLPFSRPTISGQEIEAVRQVLESGWITTGPKVTELEQALAAYIGHGVGVRLFNSATSAMEAVLLAHDIGPGDEVIVPAMSFAATANVVLRTGARPVFVDVDGHSRNLTSEAVAAALGEKTRGLIPVHFAGLAAEIQSLYELAGRHGLLVLEDAAQAIGTSFGGRRIGSWGNPVAFSFHPNKNMTTIEGGAVATSDEALMRRLERIRFHGMEKDAAGAVSVNEWGGKMNLPDVCAAVGLQQLKKLEGFNRQRRALAKRYFDKLPCHPALHLPAADEGHNWHMFCICLDCAKMAIPMPRVKAFFQSLGISLGMHYPAIHLFPLYRRLGYKPGDFPNAERIGEQTLTLPLFPAMSLEDVHRVCDAFELLLVQHA